MHPLTRSLLLGFALLATAAFAADRPSVLIVNRAGATPFTFGDFVWFKQLNEHGIQVDTWFPGERPFDWGLMSRYNCLLFLDLPVAEEKAKADHNYAWNGPPHQKEMIPLLDRYLADGGGILILPQGWNYESALKNIRNLEVYLERWGARLPMDVSFDPASETVHPRNWAPTRKGTSFRGATWRSTM